MREIKFRAWSKTLKTMYWFDVTWGNCWAMGGGWLPVVPFGEDRQYHPSNIMAIDPQESELMQFTGLHDRNGKEIWEGDVVIIDGGLKWVCKWSDNHARFYFDTGLHKTDDFDSHEPYNFEVIGNIYSNPDLLK